MKVSLSSSGNCSFNRAKKAWEAQDREYHDCENFLGKYKIPKKYDGKELPSNYKFKDEENVMNGVLGEGDLELELTVQDQGRTISMSLYPHDTKDFYLLEKIKSILEKGG